MDQLQRLSLHEALKAAPAATSVLEVGCGDGRFLSAIASCLPIARFVGVDVSARALKKAAVLLEGEPRVSLLEASVESLPMDADSSDLVVANRSLHHWEDQRAGLREISRVLRLGGSLVIADALAAGAIGHPLLRRLAEMLDGGQFVDSSTLDAMLGESGFGLSRRTPVPKSAGMLFVTVASRVR